MYKISKTGEFHKLHEFCQPKPLRSTEGQAPVAGLTLDADGNLVGKTASGGANNLGTLFRINRTGDFAVFGNFTSAKAKDDSLYGVASNPGSIYRVSLDGTYTQVHLLSLAAEGTGPNSLLQTSDGSALIEGTDGKLYGMTSQSGSFPSGQPAANGTVFTIDANLGAVSSADTINSR